MPDQTAKLRVVGVHGVHHYAPRRTPEQAAESYARNWVGHLAGGLGCGAERFDLAFAYYAPALHRGGPVVQGDDSEELDDPLATELLAAYLAELEISAPVVQGALTIPLRQLASAVAKRFSGTTTAFVRVFFREVATYLRAPDSPARVQARGIVADVIKQQEPDVVIAHSLGSVVAYEALHSLPDLRVPLLITLGSPLALPHAVHPRLLPTPVADSTRGGKAFGVRPPGVQRWVNIADPGDPVAIPPRLARGFDGIGLDLSEVVHHHVGFHHAANYLSAAATAATLAPLLGI
ncbi:hypothetical protein GCM10009839_54210 [Catenulispora yoronensis]|uniref:Serine peptidase n=1 Tax=Catenulispora yoronensis TaxID=450799 RepID=A0ABP5GCL0_9ACTN